MSRWLPFVTLLLALSGCATRPLGNGNGSNNNPDCTTLDESSCKADSACRGDFCGCGCTPTFTRCVAADAPPDITCPRLPCAPVDCGCDGLDEASCIAAESSRGCTPNYCPDSCSTAQSFAGCTNATESAVACGGNGGCAFTGCRDNADCGGPGGSVCLPPDTSGGICTCPAKAGVGCGSDADCGSGQVCDSVDCCGDDLCIPACTGDASCATGQQCNSDGHCRTIRCMSDNDCPAQFACMTTVCQRRSCSADAECGSGFCVDGACYATLGVCGVD